MNRHERRKHAALLKARRGPGGVVVLDRTEIPEGKCDLCGSHEELRPYGPRGEWICYSCGMKEPEETARQCQARVFSGVMN